jgi:hypothetical protein
MAVLAAGGWTVVEPIPMTAKHAGFSYQTFAENAFSEKVSEKLKVYMRIANTTATGHRNINALPSLYSHFLKLSHGTFIIPKISSFQ